MAPSSDDFMINSESTWVIIQGETRLELHAPQLRANFEFTGDDDFLIRLRATGETESAAISAVSFKIGDLLELFRQ
jgi:hypothetical protein